MLTALRVLTPPSALAVSISLACQHCRIDSGYDDALVGGYIEAATVWVETYLNRTLITTGYKWIVAHNGNNAGVLGGSVGNGDSNFFASGYGLSGTTDWMPLIGRWNPEHGIELPRPVLQAVSEVRIGHPECDDIVLDPSMYYVDTMSEPGRVRMRGHPFDNTFRNLQISFTAGYGDTPATIPMPIRQAVLLMTAYFYENRGDTASDVSTAVQHLLSPFRMWSFF